MMKMLSIRNLTYIFTAFAVIFFSLKPGLASDGDEGPGDGDRRSKSRRGDVAASARPALPEGFHHTADGEGIYFRKSSDDIPDPHAREKWHTMGIDHWPSYPLPASTDLEQMERVGVTNVMLRGSTLTPEFMATFCTSTAPTLRVLDLSKTKLPTRVESAAAFCAALRTLVRLEELYMWGVDWNHYGREVLEIYGRGISSLPRLRNLMIANKFQGWRMTFKQWQVFFQRRKGRSHWRTLQNFVAPGSVKKLPNKGWKGHFPIPTGRRLVEFNMSGTEVLGLGPKIISQALNPHHKSLERVFLLNAGLEKLTPGALTGYFTLLGGLPSLNHLDVSLNPFRRKQLCATVLPELAESTSLRTLKLSIQVGKRKNPKAYVESIIATLNGSTSIRQVVIGIPAGTRVKHRHYKLRKWTVEDVQIRSFDDRKETRLILNAPDRTADDGEPSPEPKRRSRGRRKHQPPPGNFQLLASTDSDEGGPDDKAPSTLSRLSAVTSSDGDDVEEEEEEESEE